jgi:hypothetical protein
MADMTNEFQKFHDEVALAAWKKDSLKTSRDAIRDRIRNYFKETLKEKVPEFHGQGSYANGTSVNPLDGEFDIDDGVYLQHLDEQDKSEWPTPETVHRWLVEATDGHTDEKPIDKRTCVRVRYAGHYHVDLPSYAKLRGRFMLAEKGDKGWHESDPQAVAEWFEGRAQEQYGQLHRIVRYLKAWADFQSGKRGKMPNGLILTVLATNHFCANDRDDVALTDTVTAISRSVSPVFFVTNPVDPTEELTARLSDEQKKSFQEAIAAFSVDAVEAVKCTEREKSSELWRKQLGDRFPLVEKDQEDGEDRRRKEDAQRVAAFYVGRSPAKPWASKE